MQIIHKIDDFLFKIFPKLKLGCEYFVVITELEKYYTYGAFKPKDILDGEWVTVKIDTSTIISQEAEYRKKHSTLRKRKVCRS